MPAGFHRAGCCCGGCGPCWVTQTTTVTTSGATGDCAQYNGEYNRNQSVSMYSANWCMWLWQADPGMANPNLLFVLLYCPSSGRWYAAANQFSDGDYDDCSGDYVEVGTDVTNYVTCNAETGVITGEFDLAGNTNCAGQTLHVVIA